MMQLIVSLLCVCTYIFTVSSQDWPSHTVKTWNQVPAQQGHKLRLVRFRDNDENHLNDASQGAATPEVRQAIPKDISHLVSF